MHVYLHASMHVSVHTNILYVYARHKRYKGESARQWEWGKAHKWLWTFHIRVLYAASLFWE